MNRKFITAWLVLFVAWLAGTYIVHSVLLHSDYQQLAYLYRAESDQQRYQPVMIVVHAILAGAFVWIYARGLEPKPWPAQGARFGLAVALLTIVPSYLAYFVVQPMPFVVVAKQIAFDGVMLIVLGMLVAWLYRDGPARG